MGRNSTWGHVCQLSGEATGFIPAFLRLRYISLVGFARGGSSVDVQDVITAVAFGFIALLLLDLLERRYTDKIGKRVAACMSGIHGQRERQDSLIPESLYVVRMSPSSILCISPGGRTESIEWDDLQRVELLTTDEGPFAPDVFWVLQGPRRLRRPAGDG